MGCFWLIWAARCQNLEPCEKLARHPLRGGGWGDGGGGVVASGKFPLLERAESTHSPFRWFLQQLRVGSVCVLHTPALAVGACARTSWPATWKRVRRDPPPCHGLIFYSRFIKAFLLAPASQTHTHTHTHSLSLKHTPPFFLSILCNSALSSWA